MNPQPDILAQLTDVGVSIWLDDISRERLTTGNLKDLVRDMHVRGVTSNPTIFAKALSQGDAYDDQVADLAVRDVSVEEASRDITTYDIRWACDVLRPVYDESGGVDGRVSLEVDPRIARDTTGKTAAEARALWWMVDRPNLFIKIPATEAGIPAITQSLSEGISVNVTLIFSLQRCRGRPGPEQDRLGGFVLRQPGGHRGRRQAGQAGHARGRGTAREGRPGQRAARLRALRAEARHPAVESPCRARCARAAPTVGLDQRQGPELRRHAVRGGPRRPGHGEHDAGGHAARHRGPRPAARQHDRRHVRGVQAGVPAARGARHPLRRRGADAGGPGRGEVRGIVERAARHDQDPDGRGEEVTRRTGGGSV